MISKAIIVKSEILSEWIDIDESVLSHYWYPYLEKRRAYGNQDPLLFRYKTIPQELYLLPERVICAINIKEHAKRKLKYNEKYYITDWKKEINVDFPYRPDFYDYKLANWKYVSQIITLYWWSTLWLFVYGNCNFITQWVWCSYCSLQQNRSKWTNFVSLITKEEAEEALILALTDTKTDIKQVMVNWWNLFDLDKGFIYYFELVERLERVVKSSGRNVDVHLIVAPPKDLNLIEKIQGSSISIAMNTEVFDDKLFEMHCPGKQKDYPHEHIYNALKKCVDILWKNRVFLYTCLMTWINRKYREMN